MRYRIKLVGDTGPDQESDNATAARTEALAVAQANPNKTVALFDRDCGLVYYISCAKMY